jgi:outer membrane protein OmpA-like peptidoglycan-associated protein
MTDLRKKLATLLAVLVFIIGNSVAQRKNLDIANDYYNQRKYVEAIQYYKRALNEKVVVNKYYMTKQVARTYLRLYDYENAATFYEHLLAYKSENEKENLYDYAMVLMNLAQYDKAKLLFEEYSQREGAKATQQHFQQMVLWAIANSTQKPIAEIKKTNIETGSRSFGYAFYNKGLIYAMPQDDKFDKHTTFYDLAYIEKSNSHTFGKPNNLGKAINQIYYEGAPTLTGDGNTMYYTANGSQLKKYKEKKKKELAITDDGVNVLQLYKSTKENGSWQQPTPLSFNNKQVNLTFPHITKDGNILFFCSDIPGGYGGLDIYFVEKLGENSWSSPVNLGPDVNTYEDDIYPFVFEQKFFYSTKGKEGFGGYDIYQGKWNNYTVTQTKNVGLPINSSKDDFAYILSDDGTTGYLSSNREGNKGYDYVYYFEMKNKAWLNGVVRNEENNSPISDVIVELYKKNSDEEWVKENQVITTNDGKWEFEIDPNESYQVKFIHPDFAKSQEVIPSVNDNDAGFRERIIDNLQNKTLTPISRFISGVVTDAKTGLPIKDVVVTLYEIRADGTKTEVNKKITATDGKWEFEVDPSKRYEVHFKHPTAGEKTMALNAHDSNDPSIRKNQLENLKNVTLNDGDNLLSGIIIDKLTDKPISDVKVTLLAKSGNKWTEINSTKSGNTGKWSFEIDPANEYKVIFEKPQYESKEFVIPGSKQGEQRKEIIEKMNPFEMKPEGKKDNVFTIYNIYFDFAKSRPQEESYKILDNIANFLKENPTISIELSAHTDAVGSDSFNLDLSQRRAERCKDYLIKQGISSARIKPVGYGETKILNHCKNWNDCSEEENQINRRVEIKVL